MSRPTTPGIRELLVADYRALFKDREGDGLIAVGRFIVRLLLNPSLQAVILLRVANASPRWSAVFWRAIMVRRFSMDWTWKVDVGPGLTIPHPVGIVWTREARAGRNFMISQNVTLGGDGHSRAPDIGDDVEIFPNAVVIGGIKIGDGAVIGAGSFVNRDVPPHTVVKRDVWEPLRR